MRGPADIVPVRAKRSWHNLPTSWDDKFRRAQRCWKEQRAYQHRHRKPKIHRSETND